MHETLKPIITTIIPTYRRPKLLKQAINSVLKQTYTNFQVFVYDNSSGDETASVVAEISKTDSRVKYYCHAENIGILNNFQYGLEHVETPFFSFLSDDDILLPEFYETVLAGFNNHPDAEFSAAGVFYLMSGRLMRRTPLERWTPGYYSPPDGLITMLEHGYSGWTGILFRKSVIERIGLLDEEIGSAIDLDFTLRIAAHCPFVVSKRPCAIFNNAATQVRPFSDKAWPGWCKMMHKLTEDDSLPADVRDYAGDLLESKFEKDLFITSMGYLCRGNLVDAEKAAALYRNLFGESVKTRVLSALIFIYKHLPFTRFAFKLLVICRGYMLTGISQKQYRDFILSLE